MTDTPTLAAVRRFLALLIEGEPPAEEELVRALDELAIAYHHTPPGKPSRGSGPPYRTDWRNTYRELAARFPALGRYAVANMFDLSAGKPMVADAIDDLADIAGDLRQVLWSAQHNGADDAHWQFRLLYRIHWGAHLRELQLYLYARHAAAEGEQHEL